MDYWQAMCIVIDSSVWFKLHCGKLSLKAVQLGDRICSVDYLVQRELLTPDGGELQANGLRIEDVTGGGVTQAAEWRQVHPDLSVADALSLALAWERHWSLATHDRLLADVARSENVPVLCVVDVLQAMAEAALLTADDVARFKRGMHDHIEDYDRHKLKLVEKTIKAIRPDTSSSLA